MGRIIKDTAERTADRDGIGCAKLVVFCNAVEDNPFMAGAFHGVGEAERGHQRGRLRPRRGAPRPADREGPAASTWWPRPSKRPPSRSPAWASWWRRRPAAAWTCRFGIVDLSPGPHPRRGRLAWPGSWRRWALEVCGTPRHHRSAGPAERRGEEGRRHGVLLRGRPVRRVHPRVSEDEGMIAAAEAGAAVRWTSWRP